MFILRSVNLQKYANTRDNDQEESLWCEILEKNYRSDVLLKFIFSHIYTVVY